MRWFTGLSLLAAVVASLFGGVYNYYLTDELREWSEERLRSFPIGPLLLGSNFSIEDIPDLTGKVAIITGANVGIGYETSLALAQKNAHVVMACRSLERCQTAASTIRPHLGKKGKVEVLVLDLGSYKSILSFVDSFRAKNLPLHILVNNAGVMMTPFQRTTDGIESQFGINHFGHYVLTKGLLDILVKSAPSRIVVLSSLAHRRPVSADPEGLFLSHVNDEKSYGPSEAYSRSKLANILHARHLAKQLADKQVYVNIVHPGAVGTDLARHLIARLKGKFGDLTWLKDLINGRLIFRPLEGALTSLYVATSPDIERNNYRGDYFVPIAHRHKTRSAGNNEALGEELQRLSENIEQQLRIRYGLPKLAGVSEDGIPQDWWRL